MLSGARFLSLYTLSAISTAYASIGPVTDLVIANRRISPDGYERAATLAGSTQDTITFPGPVITGLKGARFELNVIDKLSDPILLNSTTVHWHGIFQKGTNYADGVAFVTQCPISQGESFKYVFQASGQAGTFWYHSHLSTQSCDGLRGPFIVYDPKDPHKSLYDIDDESTIITLADWYHETYTGGVPPVSASTLINGKGRYVNGPQADLAIVNVQKGKRYRFRIIAMSCEPAFTFSIDKHLLNVIEADGENVVPIVVDSLDIHAGQRYSAVLKADQPVANYWIRANPDARALPGFDNNRNLAILRYSGAPNSDPVSNPVSTPNAVNPLKEVNLHPLISPAAPGLARPGGADVNINLVTDVDFATLHFTLNGVPFIPPTAPVLLQILSGVQNAQDLLPKGSVYALPRNKVIEISLPGTGAEKGGPHPFHLHGHSFSVIRSGDSSTYNFRNPVRRDTVSTGLAGSNTTIRFVTDNAGPWFLHCHMDFHLELGLAVVLAEDIAGTPAKIHPPQEWDQLCPLYD